MHYTFSFNVVIKKQNLRCIRPFFSVVIKKNKNKKEEELDYTTTTLMQFKMQDLKKKNVFILKSKNLKKNL